MRSFFCTNIFFAVIAASFGSGFQHGYHTGIVNISSQVLKAWIQKIRRERLNDNSSDDKITLIWSTVVAIFSVGGFLGSLLSRCFSDSCGRRAGLLWNNLVIMFAIIILGYSKRVHSYELFIFGRFLAGINSGLNGGICQVYLMEISPDRMRGLIGGFYQLVIAISILLAHLSAFCFDTEKYWHVMFVVAAIPSIFQILSLPFCPESPKFLLINRDDEEEAEAALVWLRGTQNVRDEMAKMREEQELVKYCQDMTLRKMLSDIRLRTTFVVCLVIHLGQQLCGINAVIYYSGETLDDIDITKTLSAYLMIIIGVMATIVTALIIPFTDELGRRFLLLAGFLGMAVDTLILTTCLAANEYIHFLKYVSAVFTLMFVVVFAITLGPIPWFISAEMFHHEARTLAVSLTVAANWLANFCVGQAFLPMMSLMGHYVFLVFACLDCIFYIFLLRYMPETSRRSAKDLLEIYQK